MEGDVSFCPATMCPIMQIKRSVWTGDRNAKCKKSECGWYHGSHCEASDAAREQVHDVDTTGYTLLFAEASFERGEPKTLDCLRAPECQWQREAGEKLCPPRTALSKGLDPRICLY